jgi:hypothetical protein
VRCGRRATQAWHANEILDLGAGGLRLHTEERIRDLQLWRARQQRDPEARGGRGAVAVVWCGGRAG